MEDGQIKSAYHRMAHDRQWYLDEAHESAKLTIPSIMPTNQDATEMDRVSPEDLPKPWQSLGGRGVRNITAKLGLTLFPPTGNFMRYQLHPQFKMKLEEEERQVQRTEIEQGLAAREQTIMDDVEQHNIRTKADQALRQLTVSGNVLVYLPPEGGLRVFPLNNYVCRRDFVGNVVEIIYVEPLDRATLPDAVRETLLQAGEEEDPDFPGELATDHASETSNTVNVYTRIRLRGKRYHFTQEANGHEVEAMTGSVAKDKMPFLALRFVTIDGEDYGRGYIEEFRGDLRSLEQLRKSIVVGAVNAAKLNPLIAPGAAITPKKLMAAANGQALFGRSDDVTMLQQNKHADMQVAHLTSSELVQTLSASFLLNSSFQRNAERVTAEEIRRMAEELEDALGGVFSVLSQEFQLPLAQRTEDRLVKSGALPPLEPKDAVKPVIVTGLAAIGRGHEFNRLREYTAWLAEAGTVAPNMPAIIKERELAERGAVGIGVSTEGLIKTEEEIAQERQQAQNQAMQETMLAGAAPHIGKTAADELGGTITQSQETPQPQ